MDLRSLIQSQAALIGRQNETLKQQQHLIKELGDRITKLETQVKEDVCDPSVPRACNISPAGGGSGLRM